MLYIFLLVVIGAVAYVSIRSSQASRSSAGNTTAGDRSVGSSESIAKDSPRETYEPHSPRAKYGELERHPPGATLPNPGDWRSVEGSPITTSKTQLYGQALSKALKPKISGLGKRYDGQSGKWQYIYEDGTYKVWYDSDRPGREDLQVLGPEGTLLFTTQEGTVVVTTEIVLGPWIEHFLNL